jgi:phosphogluconate dehydratase
LTGNLGRAVIKTSAVKQEHLIVHAPARVFDDQNDFLEAFKNGELEGDLVAVIRFQGPRANGMPELHKLTPSLGVLQDKGYKVAIVTDGRMSGASGKVPAAIHVTPECLLDGPLGKVRDGDMITVDGLNGRLHADVDEAEWEQRKIPELNQTSHHHGFGRELFAPFRAAVSPAEEGATVFANLGGTP